MYFETRLTVSWYLSLPRLAWRRAGIAFAYPSYMSYRALKLNVPNSDILSRLTCWAVVAGFCILCKSLLDPLFGFWVPFYYPLKVSFVWWLAVPSTNGAELMLTRFVEPAAFAVEDFCVDALGALWRSDTQRRTTRS